MMHNRIGSLKRFHVGLLVASSIVCVVESSQVGAQSPPQIVLEQPVYFVSSDGTMLTLVPGRHTIEGTDAQALRVVEQETGSAIILPATAISHEESLSRSTAAVIVTDEEAVHVLVLHPDGTALDAVGSLSQMRSRAAPPPLPGSSPAPQAQNLTPTALTQNQIQQGVQALGQMIRVTGLPPLPELTLPLPNHSIAAWGQQFEWRPGSGEPAPTSYQLCIAEVGQSCARAGQPSGTSILITNLPPTVRTYRVTGAMLQPLLAYGEQKNLTWTVAACATSSATPQLKGTIGGASSQMTCQYARPRPLIWRHVLTAPVPTPPPPLVNDRPQLSVQGPVEGAQYYLFCLDYSSPSSRTTGGCDQASREPSAQQAGASVEARDTWIINTGTALSTSGWEWKREVPILPPHLTTRIPVVGIPFSLESQGPLWSIGACLQTGRPCSWSSPNRLTLLPRYYYGGLRLTRESPTTYRLEWLDPGSAAVTHFRLCIATRGSQLRLNQVNTRDLITLPGMLRDLCSDDIPPGQQPVYQRPLPQELAAFCPTSGCQMPRPGKTIYVTGTLTYILNLREHPDLAPIGGQPLILAFAACSYSNRNCLWHIEGYRSLELPPNSRAPSLRLGYGTSSFTFNWESWLGNTYYIPCLRESSANCDTGNLLTQPRLDTPRVGTPQDHPQTCSLTGPALSGVKVLQVAGCNEAWGCRWSAPEQFNFTSIRLPPTQPQLVCRS